MLFNGIRLLQSTWKQMFDAFLPKQPDLLRKLCENRTQKLRYINAIRGCLVPENIFIEHEVLRP